MSFRIQDMVAIFDPRERRVLWHWGRGEVDPRADEVVWTYTAPVPLDFSSKTRGVVQSLPEGHKLVVNSNLGLAFEIDGDGQEVWRYRTPRTNERDRPSSVRMEHLTPEFAVGILASR